MAAHRAWASLNNGIWNCVQKKMGSTNKVIGTNASTETADDRESSTKYYQHEGKNWRKQCHVGELVLIPYTLKRTRCPSVFSNTGLNLCELPLRFPLERLRNEDFHCTMYKHKKTEVKLVQLGSRHFPPVSWNLSNFEDIFDSNS